MNPSDVEQRSALWFEQRRGLVTASRIADILAKTKAGVESAARRNYRTQLVLERITGTVVEGFENAAMRWGTETEPLARMSYTLATGNAVNEVGFIKHDVLEAGASPDGYIGEDGQTEIKCPESANHLETIRLGHMPPKHKPQVQWQLTVTGRQWCDFISFDPRMPANAQLFIQRIERDDEYIRMLETEVALFLDEVDAEEAFVRAYGVAA